MNSSFLKKIIGFGLFLTACGFICDQIACYIDPSGRTAMAVGSVLLASFTYTILYKEKFTRAFIIYSLIANFILGIPLIAVKVYFDVSQSAAAKAQVYNYYQVLKSSPLVIILSVAFLLVWLLIMYGVCILGNKIALKHTQK